MENCACGFQLRKYWLWHDSNAALHASAFEPTSGAVRAVYAANARDAVLPTTESAAPKHDVLAGDDPTVRWEGRCTVLSQAG